MLTAPEPPKVRFTDVTTQAGLGFVHFNGATGQKLLPETMGGGCAFLDFDGDGDQDLVLVNSTSWPGAAPEKTAPTMKLFQNDGSGRFKDVTKGSGLDVSFYGMGVAAGDYDNDGLPDLFFSAVGGNRLFHNLGHGRFSEVTDAAGLGSEKDLWSTSAAWFDYNNDGRLDLFVCNYVKWTAEIDQKVGAEVPGLGRVYAPPFKFEGSHPRLYRNDGDGHFVEVSTAAKLRVTNPTTGAPAAKSLGVAPVDIDGDGWMDLIVANDTVPNQVFRNLGNGTFEEMGGRSGLAYDGFGNVRGAMGIDTSWFLDDQSLGVAIANFANEMNGFYVAKPGTFEFADEASKHPLGPASRLPLKFGLFFFDYDLDGWPDLLTANGHLDEGLARLGKQQPYAQPAQLFWNGGPAQSAIFTPVSPEFCGKDLYQPMVGRGAAYADIDGDGDLDVILTQVGGSPKLLRNELDSKANRLRIKLVGTRCNRDAIGARVTTRSANRIWQAQVMPTRSYLSQSELPVTFGFGREPVPAELEVWWPGGGKQTVRVTKGARFIEVRQKE